jgi:flagellum-specific ATP synthase
MTSLLGDARRNVLSGVARPLVTGAVARVVGLRFDVSGVQAGLGDEVWVERTGVKGVVVGLDGDTVACMPLGDISGLRSGDRVVTTGALPTCPVGWDLLGKVLDGMGDPLDGSSVAHLERCTLDQEVPHPLNRRLIREPLALGVRAWDATATLGRGQRVGVFAGSGVGKSTLMGMVARNTAADVNVVALIGERGREVREFIENDLGPEGLKRSVLVVATSDQPALVRTRAAFMATRIAEWFRDQGSDVLLMMDSLTRFCMAQREIGLAAGEMPAARGYTPSVFATLPKLLERAGSSDTGSVTGIYTVLVDGDDHNEPISDASRSILDGHITLSRAIAHRNHYPAIDVLASVSRVMSSVTEPDNRKDAGKLRQLMAALAEAKDLIEIGAYSPGSNPVVDEAITRKSAIDAFLQQDTHEKSELQDTWRLLNEVVS